MLGGMAAFAAGRALPSVDLSGAPSRAPDPSDSITVGPGGWCWFQSPRAVIDRSGALWVGSTQGTGAPVPGSVDVTKIALPSGRVLERLSLGVDRVDDHTSPAVLADARGVWAAWAPHRRADWLDLGPARGPRTKLHRPAALSGPGRGTSYISAHRVAGQDWILYRGEQFSWNLLTSPDRTNWTERGLVIQPPTGGHRPYVVARSDGARLHLLVSDGNPSEYRGTGVHHARIEADRSITSSTGRTLGQVGRRPVPPSRMTMVRPGRTGSDESSDVDVWMSDIVLMDGRPIGLLSVRDPWPERAERVGQWRHRYLRAEADARGRWSTSHLAWAGSELYPNQPDYSGLGALHPTDPTTVVISTDVHPVHGAPLVSAADRQVHHELWRGYRTDAGSWTWAALTSNSIEDNLRPVLVSRAGVTALAWMRGTYRSWTDFSTDIVLRVL